MWRAEELDEAADNTGLDNLLDRWVSLLRKELSELGGGLNLEIDLVGENAGNHLWKILVQLYRKPWLALCRIILNRIPIAIVVIVVTRCNQSTPPSENMSPQWGEGANVNKTKQLGRDVCAKCGPDHWPSG